MSKIKRGEHQRTPYMTEAGMYRKKPPRRKNTGPGIYSVRGGLFSASSLTDAKKQAAEWHRERRSRPKP